MIEADEYEKLAAATFVRGYLRSFSKALEVDVDRVFKAYAAMGYGDIAASPIKMQSFSKRKVRERNDNRLMLISYLIIAIVIAMAVVWWWQEGGLSLSNEPNIDSNTRTSVAASSNNSNNDSSRTDVTPRRRVNQPTPVTTEEPEPQPQIEPEPEQRLVAAEPVASEPETSEPEKTEPEITEPASRANTSPATIADTAMAELVMNFSAACWVKVTDASGRDIAIGVKEAGYTMPLRGEPPFDIILCKPEAVTMTYNGEAVDLSGYRRSRSVTMTLNQ